MPVPVPLGEAEGEPPATNANGEAEASLPNNKANGEAEAPRPPTAMAKPRRVNLVRLVSV
ncbi:hypothetical protein GCM10017774_79060 [Lentzea cavernae]|uniref:Uncharacterized protein n=1 Tax=Lentzea cavernae TaxID=2020703 RepID=A0ABQ3MTA9_9PSEU|nr:hypothetical protein GCM10017774_79060 [Lentzea cavernae]